MLSTIFAIDVEDVPDELYEEVWKYGLYNGGTVVSVTKDSAFGQYLITQGYIFAEGKTWGHLAIFR